VARSNKKQNRKWGSGNFVAIPSAVLKSQGYASLSAHAVKLLNDLLSQYHGNNNGNLCAALKLMKSRGWNSNYNLTSARRELTDKGFIAVSRMGGRNHATLFSITFYSIDECINSKTKLSRHEVRSSDKPANIWKNFEPKKTAMNIKAAQKKQRCNEIESDIRKLEKDLEDNPNDENREQILAGIKFLKSRQD